MLRLLIIFVILSVASVLAISLLGVEFSKANYWDHHGILLLIFLTFFPRLALLFSSIPFGGLFWWLGFLFCPHYLVAILATLTYWPTNPILVTISWFVALGGEATEKYYVEKTLRKKNRVIVVPPAE
jgi:hypothetical protein